MHEDVVTAAEGPSLEEGRRNGGSGVMRESLLPLSLYSSTGFDLAKRRNDHRRFTAVNNFAVATRALASRDGSERSSLSLQSRNCAHNFI